jgi:hypothetical protein
MALDINAAIQAKIAAGVLSLARLPSRASVASGTRRQCDVCGELIVSTDIEYEVELANGRAVHLHRTCYWAWFDACAAEKRER